MVNVHQQAPEIGLLQALGLCRARLYRVYLYEIAVLVFIAGSLGGGIGVGMSWLIGAWRLVLEQHRTNGFSCLV